VRQTGQHVPAGAEVADEPDAVLPILLPPLVALEVAEGAHMQGVVDHDKRVHVPRVGDRRALPDQRRLVGAGLDAPHGVVPARADVGRAVEPAHVVGVADGVVPLVGAHASGVVRQELAGRGLFPGGTQHPPQPAPADAQARRRQVVEGLGRAGAEVVEPATPLAEPADQHVRAGEEVPPSGGAAVCHGR